MDNTAIYVWLSLLTLSEIITNIYHLRKTNEILAQLAKKKNLKEFTQKEVKPDGTAKETRYVFWREKEEYKGTEKLLKEKNGKKRKC